jgi:hypothetical protein
MIVRKADETPRHGKMNRQFMPLSQKVQFACRQNLSESDQQRHAGSVTRIAGAETDDNQKPNR